MYRYTDGKLKYKENSAYHIYSYIIYACVFVCFTVVGWKNAVLFAVIPIRIMIKLEKFDGVKRSVSPKILLECGSYDYDSVHCKSRTYTVIVQSNTRDIAHRVEYATMRDFTIPSNRHWSSAKIGRCAFWAMRWWIVVQKSCRIHWNSNVF